MRLHLKTRLTAIGSGKGGTGKTFVAVGLAHALSQQGERILLFDADIGLANTAVQLGLDDGGDFDAVRSTGRLTPDDVALVGGGIRVRGGFDLLAAPAGSGAFADLDIHAATRMIASLRAANRYDRILLDLAAGVSAVTIAFAASADESLLVLTPDPASLTDAYAFVKLVLRQGGRLPATIVNMAAGEADSRRTGDALARTCLAFLKRSVATAGSIPRDSRVPDAVRRQTQILAAYPQSPAARALLDIARRLHAEQGVPAIAGSIR